MEAVGSLTLVAVNLWADTIVDYEEQILQTVLFEVYRHFLVGIFVQGKIISGKVVLNLSVENLILICIEINSDKEMTLSKNVIVFVDLCNYLI